MPNLADKRERKKEKKFNLVYQPLRQMCLFEFPQPFNIK
jgi:hypothetical protein